ncbi:MAG: tetratricopeptide repeat protein, partial [Promethearchaeota archaeon]
MVQNGLKKLARAEDLFSSGNLEGAYELLKDLIQDPDLDFEQKSRIQYFQGLILAYQNKNKKLMKLGREMSSYAQSHEQKHHHFDGLFFLSFGLGGADKFAEVFKVIKKADKVLKDISGVPYDILLIKSTRLNILKAWANFNEGRIEASEKFIDKVLSVEKELGDRFETIWAYLLRSHILMQVKFDFSSAMECIEKAMSMAKRTQYNHYWIAFSHIAIGVFKSKIYEYEASLDHHFKALEIFKKINNDWYIANILNNIGLIYCDIGNYDLAQKYLEESLELWETFSLYKGALIDSLIYVALEVGDIKKAKMYLEHLKDKYEEKNDKYSQILYTFNKAAILKTSNRIRDISEAEKLFTQIIETETLFFESKIYAYIHICDILLTEYSLNYNDEVLEELNGYIPKLLKIAKNKHSYLVFCETFILQAKLALLNLNFKAAQRFLTQAQKVAESNGIMRLARKISFEHDKLIEQFGKWRKLKDEHVPVSERWKFAGLSEQIKRMKKKGLQDVPDISDEKPIYLLIVSEGGMPFFSQSFTSDKKFEEHLFGGFFITLNSFIIENFSEGLNRASFGEYTLL